VIHQSSSTRTFSVTHRVPAGRAKTCALVKDGDQWFAAVTREVEVPEPDPAAAAQRPAVGIDRGVALLLADSDGRVVQNPRAFEAHRPALAKAQRRAARKRKGSKNQQRAKARMSRIHRRSRRQREAVLHRESKHYAESQGAVFVERLDVRGMTRSASGTLDEPGTNVAQKAGLNRAILDAGWGRFLGMLRYKSLPLGTRVGEVPSAFSSQTCAACGHVSSDSRKSQSKFECVACGHRANADVNAAQVILRRGTHGAEGFGGDAVGRPVKKQLRVVRRAPRPNAEAAAPAKATALRPG
jgi:putative transposase